MRCSEAPGRGYSPSLFLTDSNNLLRRSLSGLSRVLTPLRAWATLGASVLLVFSLGGCPSSSNGGADGVDNNGDGVVDDPLNDSPAAYLAASPANLTPGAEITLDASTSTDPNGDALSFEWSQVAGSTASMPASGDAVLKLAAPYSLETEELRFRVVVRDGRGGEASAEASIFVNVGDEFAGHPQAASAYRESLTADEAYHLLRRAAFGATPEQVSAAVSRGLTATVDDLMSFKTVPAEVEALAASYENDIPRRWMTYMIEGPNPLNERLALFWHDRFATSRRVLNGYDELAVQHMEMLRLNAPGNYRAFLQSLTLDPLMLLWLNGADSPKNDPNENYAREFWELFTLGRDMVYTEADVKESARAFTGITLFYDWPNLPRPIFDIVNHDNTNKTIFSGRGVAPMNYDYEGVIDLTLAQPEAARYVARNLFVALVHDHPSDALVQDLADTFTASNFEIAPLVRKILMSQAMFSADTLGNQISSPVEHIVGVARTLDMHIYSEDSQGWIFYSLMDDLAGAGQDLLNPPGVDGWKENEGWLEDQWVIHRIDALGRTMEYGPNRTSDLPYHLLPPTSTWNQRDIGDRMVDAMAAVFHLELTPDEHDVYVDVLDQDGWKAFYLENPNYQPQHVFEMIRLMAMDERVIGK